MSTLRYATRYAITDRTQYGETELNRRAGLLAQVSRLAAEGVDVIQLREKDLPAQDLIGLAREILSIIRMAGSGTRLLINARADVAFAASAHGVHLPGGKNQLMPLQVRRLFRDVGDAKSTVSVACHTLEDVRQASAGEADLILFGPIFGKAVHGKIVVPGSGLEALQAACEVAGKTPVLALGGVTAENSAEVIASGAAGVAAIRLFR